jgi:hypothetical protein
MFINRNWTRTENDDFILNIQDRIQNSNKEALPIYDNETGKLMGWKIQTKYE